MDILRCRRAHNEGGNLNVRLCELMEHPYFTLGMDARFKALFKFTELNMLLTSCLAAIDVAMDNGLEYDNLAYNHMHECSIQHA